MLNWERDVLMSGCTFPVCAFLHLILFDTQIKKIMFSCQGVHYEHFGTLILFDTQIGPRNSQCAGYLKVQKASKLGKIVPQELTTIMIISSVHYLLLLIRHINHTL